MFCDNKKFIQCKSILAFLIGFTLSSPIALVNAEDLAQYPLFVSGADAAAPPLTMLIMGKDHTLYYEAYNDASDLSGDGVLDVGYKPNMVDADGNQVDYFGYFDSHLCYDYSSSNNRFTPVSATISGTKKCSGYWSGDFLNYITTSRIDALRKVLYGGKRIVDEPYDPDDPNAVITVLERSYIPQDAHSWGKEYLSEAHDGYLISDYTPLSQPVAGTRHLFANTTLANESSKKPLMRVLTNSNYRIWEWVAIERPVADDQCDGATTSRTTCTTAAVTSWETVPSALLELTQTTYKKTGNSPTTKAQFDTLVTTAATPSNLCGSQTVSTINGSGNPFNGINGCTNDNYLTIFDGTITIPSDGNYTFAIDGDDAVDLQIGTTMVADWYGGHGACNCTTHNGTIYLTAGSHAIRFRHEEKTGGDSYALKWQRSLPSSDRTDYTVRVQVCKTGLLDANCKPYTDIAPDPDVVTYKPDGLLQQYGKNNSMLFGLISGSFKHPTNMRGGVLRKNIESFMNEIDPDLGEVDPATGVFTDLPGIVRTIDQFRIVDFNSGTGYSYSGGWLATSPMVSSNSQFPDWGNPIAEMMYESLRYFSGKTSPTSDFMPTLTSGKERVTLRDYASGESSTMDLPAPTWVDPYTTSSSLYCSPGAQLVISDVNPSFDTDQVPGTAFTSSLSSNDITGLNVATEANAIWNAEHGGSSSHFIGQVDTFYDGAPTAKTVSGLGNIRGLSPSEPTKQGGYYSASIARYAFENDLRSDLADKQDINTFSVALASPLPKIVIPVDDKLVTLVPFAKSVGGYSINAAEGQFQPTNQIVDFFVDTFANTDPEGSDEDPDVNEGRPFVRFRINYEDVEQGADHDMDAIVVYELKVNEDNTLTVTLTSEYAAGSIMHHMGYVISGTTDDGVYLEVRDADTSTGDDPDYFLDTPAGVSAGGCAQASPPTACAIAGTDTPLPLSATRTFTASDTNVATVLNNPLWYAAKYGSEGNEGLASGEPSPNYFLVTNAGKLQEQLEDAFTRIINLTRSSAASAAASSTRARSDTLIYQAKFDPSDWSGSLTALSLFDDNETDNVVWDAEDQLPNWDERQIYTWNATPDDDSDPTGIAFTWAALNTAQKAYLSNDQTILNWLRGDQSAESTDNGVTGWRVRTKILGDIVHSDPLYVDAPQNVGYASLPVGTAGRDTYSTPSTGFLAVNADRTPMIYVGANDGMLHAFDAATGLERFAYVPNAVFGKLKDLASPSYRGLTPHRDFVDGSPAVGDAYVNNAWRSILIGTLGTGGKAVFALDVTNPLSFSADNVLWEFTDSDLGYMVGQMTSSAVIGRLQNGHWAVVFGNGYDSGTGAWLYIVDLDDGSLLKKIQVSDDINNGLSAVALIRDSQQTIVGAYAGDLKGNLWKFDLTGSMFTAYSGIPLFRAIDDNDPANPIVQPITGPLDVGAHPLGGYIVYFGTGQYMRPSDVSNRSVQSVYGIWDNAILGNDVVDPSRTVWEGGTAITTGRAELLEQEIINELELPNDPDNNTWRVISQHSMEWGTRSSPDQRGWFIDLISPVHDVEGERVVSRPQILSGNGQVLFTSVIPLESDDPCVVGGGNSWIFAVDLFTGGSSTGRTFDVNADNEFDENDTLTLLIRDGETYIIRGEEMVSLDGDGEEILAEYTEESGDQLITVPASGMRMGQIIDSPRVLIDEENNYVPVVAGSDGDDAEEIRNIAAGLFGRLGWRQLR